RREPPRPASADPVRRRQARRAGDRDRRRDAAQLRRQQAVVVPPPLMRRLLGGLILALALVPAARAATTPTVTQPVYDSKGRLVQTPFIPVNATHLTKHRALVLVEHNSKVAAWLARYPNKQSFTDEEDYDPKTATWT